MNRFAIFLVVMLVTLGSCTSLFQKGQNQFSAGEYQLAINTFSRILEEDPQNQGQDA